VTDDLEAALKSAMAHRTAHATPDLSPADMTAGVRRRHRRRNRRLSALATAAAITATIASLTTYRSLAANPTQPAAATTHRAVTTTPHPTRPNVLCAGLPQHPTKPSQIVGHYIRHPYAKSGLRLTYIPPGTPKAPQHENGDAGIDDAGPTTWSNSYAWYWGNPSTSPDFIVQVVCGTGAESPYTFFQGDARPLQIPKPVMINSRQTYFPQLANHQPAAFIRVSPGIAVVILASSADLLPITRGLHITG
jgi:hypothetical protein